MKIPTRFPNIARHARLLGFSRGHLYRVLIGDRPLKPEMRAKYNALVAADANIKNEIGATLRAGTVLEDCHAGQINEIVSAMGGAAMVEGERVTLTEDFHFALVPLPVAKPSPESSPAAPV